MNLTDQLNPEQLEAVYTIDGPVLVLAGAGSGKTRVVTYRIVELLRRGIHPSSILGLTFTNKAAEEMKERVRTLTQNHVLICTFHSLGARILRESIHHFGYKSDFTIYDEKDTEKIMKVCMSELGIPTKVEPKAFLSLISHAKNALIGPEDAVAPGNDPIAKLYPKVYQLYQSKLFEYNALDFDDLLFLPVKLFQQHKNVLEHYRNRWEYLLIDEYQDTNAAQYTIVRYLIEKTNNICVVGDPDQSIYSWRGANVQNILNFELDFPGAKVVRLEQNYRSHTHILEAANALIENNGNRFEKNLWSNLGPGEKIKRFTADTEREEAEFVAERIRHHYENDQISLNQMVIFYRTNAQSRPFEDRFLARHIPYVIVGGISFYQRREIKDILAFLRIVHSGADYISFVRTINLPKRGIGETTIEKIRMSAAQEAMTIFGYCEHLAADGDLSNAVRLSAKQKENLKDYVAIIHSLKKINQTCSLTELVKSAITHTHYIEYLSEDKESFEERQANLNALVSKALEWELATPNGSLADFLEELSLKSSLDDSDTTKERVNLMTVHNGKGLEFKTTFLVGMEEDLFPHANSRENDSALEEERRLCYVGMTRAKDHLYLCEARQRFLWGVTRMQRPSRFFLEIPEKNMERFRYSHKTYDPPRIRRPREDDFIDDMDQTIPQAEEAMNELIPGAAVFHNEFGIGVIQKAYETSAGLTYKILFSKDQRERSIVAKYGRLKTL